MTDPMGTDYGPFDNPDQAYRFFDAKFNETSIRENLEYRMDIYRMPSGNYYLADPTRGLGDTANRPTIDVKGAIRAGITHSHGNWSKGFFDEKGKQHITGQARNRQEDSFHSERPSKTDEKTAKDTTVYTSTPTRQGWKQGPGDQAPQAVTPMRDRNDKPVSAYPHLTPQDVEKGDMGKMKEKDVVRP